MSVNEKMTAIADAIRDKTGTAEPLTLDDMARGVNEVYDKGSAEGWTEFQNLLTNNGKRRVVNRMFTETDFTGKTFNPIWCPILLGSMFYNYSGKELPSGIDCSKAEQNETSIDHSVCPVLFVGYCYKLENFPDIGIKPYKDITQMFRDCVVLRWIEVLRVFEETTFSNTFYACRALKHIRFEGVIGRDISFSSSPLDIDSLKDIIFHLKKYAGTDSEGTYTLTLEDECKTKLQEDTQTVELDGEVYTYFELIAAKGWNLA